MTHLPKHLRPRFRYVAVNLQADGSLTRNAFQNAVWAEARSLHGDVGSAAIDMEVLRFTFAGGSGTAIIRARRGETDRARAALACIDRIDGTQIGLSVLGMSGTVRACEEKYISDGPKQNT